MPTTYVRSTDGVNTDDGSTWALARLDLAGATAADAAGDIIYVSQAHAESTTGTVTIAAAGTPAAPSRIICANDAAEPPTTAATTATVTATSTLTVTGCLFASGLTLNAGNTSSATQSLLIGTSTANHQVYEDCSLRVMTSGTGLALLQIGDDTRTDATRVTLRDTTLRLGGTTHRVKINTCFKWEGGGWVSGGTTPTSIFSTGTRGVGEFLVSNVDFATNLGTGFHMIAQPSGGNALTARFRNCLLPSGWTGNLWSATPLVPSIRAVMLNCFAGSTKIRLWTWDFAGQVRDNTTVYRASGATDDGVGFSYRMASYPDAEYPSIPLEGEPIKAYVDGTGATTLTIEIIHDSQGSGTGSALRNDEIGVKVSYPGGFLDTFKADALAAPADLASSAVTWTSTGLITPVKQKISFTFTPTSKGDVIITPVLFGASKTVYLCPKVSA